MKVKKQKVNFLKKIDLSFMEAVATLRLGVRALTLTLMCQPPSFGFGVKVLVYL